MHYLIVKKFGDSMYITYLNIINKIDMYYLNIINKNV